MPHVELKGIVGVGSSFAKHVQEHCNSAGRRCHRRANLPCSWLWTGSPPVSLQAAVMYEPPAKGPTCYNYPCPQAVPGREYRAVTDGHMRAHTVNSGVNL